MGLDRRILSILYYNDIVDVNDVEEFIASAIVLAATALLLPPID